MFVLDCLDLLYGVWWWSALCCTAVCVVGIAVLLLSDCDLVLACYSRLGIIGRAPEVALCGKVIWVTGASSGIGENLCYVLARCGAVLILSARRDGELKRVRNRCNELSPDSVKGQHMVLTMDLRETHKHSTLAKTVLEKYGKIDYLVNNAGRSQRAEAVATELAVDKELMDLNFVSTISLTKAVLPEMIECREGCVVVMSSVAGKIGAPGSASYSASKHALQGYFETLRMELADKNISILSVCPGPVDTPIARNLFSEKISSVAKGPGPGRAGVNRVSAERCAELIAITMANKLYEVWISKKPILLFIYLYQYFPNLSNWVGQQVGNKRLHAIKEGKSDVNKFFGK